MKSNIVNECLFDNPLPHVYTLVIDIIMEEYVQVGKGEIGVKSKETYDTTTIATNNHRHQSRQQTKIYNFALTFPSSSCALSFNTLLKIFPLTLLGISSTNFTPPLNFL